MPRAMAHGNQWSELILQHNSVHTMIIDKILTNAHDATFNIIDVQDIMIANTYRMQPTLYVS